MGVELIRSGEINKKVNLQETTSVEVLFGAESPDDTDVL